MSIQGSGHCARTFICRICDGHILYLTNTIFADGVTEMDWWSIKHVIPINITMCVRVYSAHNFMLTRSQTWYNAFVVFNIPTRDYVLNFLKIDSKKSIYQIDLLHTMPFRCIYQQLPFRLFIHMFCYFLEFAQLSSHTHTHIKRGQCEHFNRGNLIQQAHTFSNGSTKTSFQKRRKNWERKMEKTMVSGINILRISKSFEYNYIWRGNKFKIILNLD